MTDWNKIKEYNSEDIDRIVIDEENKRVKMVLEDGKRILVDYKDVSYID